MDEPVLARFFLLIFPAAYAVGAWAQTPQHVESASSRAANTHRVSLPFLNSFLARFPSRRNPRKRANPRTCLGQVRKRHVRRLCGSSSPRNAEGPTVGHRVCHDFLCSAPYYSRSCALAKAESLLSRATLDEQLLVRWMTYIQGRNLLPAITSMNDLLKRYLATNTFSM